MKKSLATCLQLLGMPWRCKEYARDENTGGAYDGLFAVLLCRVVVGSSYVVEKPGNYTAAWPFSEHVCHHPKHNCFLLHRLELYLT